MAFGVTLTSYTPSLQTRKGTHSSASSARIFGTWTFLAAVVRCYVAYNISNGGLYGLGIWTYVIAMAHFAVEWIFFGARGGSAVSALVVSTTTLVWMLVQWDFYVK